jgi:hypothetical protein
MTDINWGILRPVDIGAAATDGYNAGRLQKRQQATQDILAGYGSNPTAGVPAQLWALDPNIAATLSQNDRQRVVADRATQDALRTTQARNLGAGLLRQHTGAPSVSAALPITPADMATSGRAPATPGVTSEGDEITVTAASPSAASQAPPISVADVFQQDPELAGQVIKHMGDLDENGRKAFGQKTSVAAALSLAASHLPLDQRQAYIDDHAPLLREAGWTNDEIGGFDPHDDNLKGMIAIGVGADKILSDERQAAGQAVTVRGQDVSAATSRRGQDISASTSRRGQDIGAATARSGQAITMRGQDMAAAGRVAPKPATVALAKGKLSSLTALENQLNRAEAALKKAKYTGPIAGRLPGGISGADSAADAAISNLAPLVRQLTRVPGEGAMSDYESKLAQAGLPSRAQTAEGRRQSLDDIRALVKQTRAGYSDLLGDNPAPASNRGFKVVR